MTFPDSETSSQILAMENQMIAPQVQINLAILFYFQYPSQNTTSSTS